MSQSYYVYILASKSRALYIGVTNDIIRRVQQHKEGRIPGFTSKYKINRLVYCEEGKNIYDAIAREKQLKGWLRAKKIALIESLNPNWDDLSKAWEESGTEKRAAERDPSLRSG